MRLQSPMEPHSRGSASIPFIAFRCVELSGQVGAVSARPFRFSVEPCRPEQLDTLQFVRRVRLSTGRFRPTGTRFLHLARCQASIFANSDYLRHWRFGRRCRRRCARCVGTHRSLSRGCAFDRLHRSPERDYRLSRRIAAMACKAMRSRRADRAQSSGKDIRQDSGRFSFPIAIAKGANEEDPVIPYAGFPGPVPAYGAS